MKWGWRLFVIGVAIGWLLCFRIISALSPEERGMFRERIKYLDKKLQPGLTKLTWATRGVSEFFIQDYRTQAAKVGFSAESSKHWTDDRFH